MSSTFERIYALVARIPYGQVATYGQIARHLGMPQSARLVGWAMHTCPPGLPWHRVVNREGKVSPRSDGSEALQRALLEEEGIVFDAQGRIDLKRYGWPEI